MDRTQEAVRGEMEAPLPPQPKYVYSVHSEEGRPAFPPVPYGPMFAPDVRDTEFWTGNPVWCPGSAPTAQDALGTAVPARSLEARLCQAYQCHSGRTALMQWAPWNVQDAYRSCPSGPGETVERKGPGGY